MDSRPDRRTFLKTAALGTTGFLILPKGDSAFGYPANEKLNIALVGLGKRGRRFVHFFPTFGHNLVALCDVNKQRTAEYASRAPRASQYQDFRQMLEEMDRQIDAVIVATPDNNHALISAAAMKRGKHVYCEKPIAHDVVEARALRRIAREQKVATQMGNQGMASDQFRRTLELIHEGVVGDIREVHTWYIFGGSGPRKRPKERPPVPKHLRWDLWLSPVPLRPYHPTYVNGWGAWRDISSGLLGGGGSHSLNLMFKALKLGALWDEDGKGKGRIRVEAEPSEHCVENFPRWQTIRFDFPARGSLPPARLYWYNASEPKLKELGIWRKLEKIAGRPLQWPSGWTPRSGSLLVGSKGVVHTNAHNSLCALLPKSDFPGALGPPRNLPRVKGHEHEWASAAKGGIKPLSNFDHSGPVIEMALLGNIATLVGQPIEFDPVACNIPNHPEAHRALRREYGKGWAL